LKQLRLATSTSTLCSTTGGEELAQAKATSHSQKVPRSVQRVDDCLARGPLPRRKGSSWTGPSGWRWPSLLLLRLKRCRSEPSFWHWDNENFNDFFGFDSI
jgi:hypothetical protein